MARRLVRHVDVHDADGNAHLFAPGDVVPEWAAALITNPKAWASEDDLEPTPEGGDEGESKVPPTSGRGSGRPAWAEYAKANEVEVDDDMSRDDIVAAVEAAGVPIA